MNKTANYTSLFPLLAILLLLSSCGPVNRHTRIKKIPQEYSLNYGRGMEEMKVPKSDLNKEPWIVFSDKEKNSAYNNPGGKVKLKDVDFLDAFLVIKQKGDFLKLVKYTPDVLKNGKFDYKKAEYYGWMHKSGLLLNQQSVTDLNSGKKKKMMALISDTTIIRNGIEYYEKDSLFVFKDLDLRSQGRKILPYSVVYQMKESSDGRKSLIAAKPYIKGEDASKDILGWIDNSLIRDIGQGLHVALPTIPRYTLQATLKEDVALSLSEIIEENQYLANLNTPIKYTPVISYSVKDSLVAYKVRVAQPVLDNSDSYILNVNGGQINFREFRKMTKQLKEINVVFVFEGREQTITQFPQIINAIQNMQPLFEQPDDSYTYKFGTVLTFDDSNRLVKPAATGLVSDYSVIINFLTEKANNKDSLSPIKLPRTWGGLRKALDMVENHKNATNLIVLIGEKGNANETIDAELASKLSRNNCRILGFQVYSADNNIYNNFVLDIEAMINAYATDMLKTKGEILVNNGQIKRSNSYKEVGGAKNSFRLDFPYNSITQGSVLFPQKGQMLPLDILTNNVDTLIQQIREDNQNIITNMATAFTTVGNNRAKYTGLFKKEYNLAPYSIPSRKFAAGFNNNPLGWSFLSDVIYLTDFENNYINYQLMLSENEVREMKEFVDALSAYEVDYKYQAKNKKKKRNLCNCPEDDLFVLANQVDITIEAQALEMENDMLVNREYENTSKIRKYLKKYYLKVLKNPISCKEKVKDKDLERLTLAEAHRRITGVPTTNLMMKTIKIKDLGNKNIVTDKMLDELIGHFIEARDFSTKAEQFDSNGETYFWVNRNQLP